jgi:hypothetical protein
MIDQRRTHAARLCALPRGGRPSRAACPASRRTRPHRGAPVAASVHEEHNGTANFGVTVILPAAGETAPQSYELSDFSDFAVPFNLIGAVKSAGVVMTTTPGDHYLIVSATGAWQLSVEQPLPETVTPVTQMTFSGKGQDVSPYFTVPEGITTISVQTASHLLYGWLYHLDDLGGEPVMAGIAFSDGRIFDFTFPGNMTSASITLPDSGPYLIAVANTLTNSDAWTITLS